MELKKQKIDSGPERNLCIGLIISDNLISQLSTILTPEIATTGFTKRIISWCLDYYQEYKKAPQLQMQSIFDTRKEELFDDAEVEQIALFLGGLSEEAEKIDFNEQFFIDTAKAFIRKRTVELTCEKALGAAEKDLAEAEGLLTTYKVPDLPVVDTSCFAFTPEFWASFEDPAQNPLFYMKGALGELMGPILRSSFISLLAVEKAGKTNFMLYMGLQAYRQRNNVLFLSCGDMAINELKSRWRLILTGNDTKNKRTEVKVPELDCKRNQEGSCPFDEDTDPILVGNGKKARLGTFDEFPDHVCCKKCQKTKNKEFQPVVWQKTIYDPNSQARDLETVEANLRKRSGGKRFAMMAFSPNTLTVSQIRTLLEDLKNKNDFVPDVLIVDYADILAPERSAARLDVRHQINDIWIRLRALSQDMNCALITATQAKLEARKRGKVEQWDASEDKRKLAHVTAMFSLNQTAEDFAKGLVMVSCLLMRDGTADLSKSVAVLQSIPMGKPYIDSYFCQSEKPKRKQVKNEKESEGK